MTTKTPNTRRSFLNQLSTGTLAAAGLAFIPQGLKAGSNPLSSGFASAMTNGAAPDATLKQLGKMQHPVAFDMSSVIPFGLIWSNVYYMTNSESGTPEAKLGVLNVFRHHGMIYAMNDATIQKYKLGEFFGFNDPLTTKPATKNPYYTPEDGVFPLPGLAGIKQLQEKGTKFFVCDMARKVYAQFVAKQHGADPTVVYNDFVKGTLPGIEAAPSGVWALGRLAENGIAYIDASVG